MTVWFCEAHKKEILTKDIWLCRCRFRPDQCHWLKEIEDGKQNRD